MKNKNEKLLKDFATYCKKHPSLRFWQALHNWSGFSFIYVSDTPSGEGDLQDTYYFEDK